MQGTNGMSRKGWAITIGLAVVGLAVLSWAWLKLPTWLLERPPNVTSLKPIDYFNAANSIRATAVSAFAQVVGIPVALGALFFAWRQLTAGREQAEKTNEATLAQLEIARRAQTADRFTKAVEQLGNESDDVRIGGIYALGQILKEPNTEGYHEPIVEILTAYLRQHHPYPAPPEKEDVTTDRGWPGGRALLRPPADVHAVVSSLRHYLMYDPAKKPPVLNIGRVDLRHVDLTGIDLTRAQLQQSNFSWANLRDAHLAEAKLEVAVLDYADLRGARLDNAHLDAATLRHTHLADAGEPTTRAVFAGADIRGADLTDAIGLEDPVYVEVIVAGLDDDCIGGLRNHPTPGTTKPQQLMDAYERYKQTSP